ncbi:MAG: 30S ribosomal protein S7, partial [Chitinophagales bacterium]|nr:30S ribosomal protein S7 [Chitinophagales bacterium]
MRKSRAKKRPILPDPRFNDEMVTRFVNTLLKQGKKTTAFQIFYDTIDKISETTKEEGFPIWKKAVENLMPAVEVRSRRIGGATFQIPAEVRPNRKLALSMKWLINYSAARSGRSMADKLAAESIAAAKGEGAAFKKKEDTHKMAEANKA